MFISLDSNVLHNLELLSLFVAASDGENFIEETSNSGKSETEYKESNRLNSGSYSSGRRLVGLGHKPSKLAITGSNPVDRTNVLSVSALIIALRSLWRLDPYFDLVFYTILSFCLHQFDLALNKSVFFAGLFFSDSIFQHRYRNMFFSANLTPKVALYFLSFPH